MPLANRSISTLLATLLALGFFLSPQLARAQTAEQPDPVVTDASKPADDGQLFDQSHRKRIYEAKKLSYGAAAAWGLAFPGLGNIYVDQYLLAGLAFISMVFSGFFVGYGVWTGQSDLLWTGIGIAGVTYGWSLGTALFGVKDANEELRRNLHLDDEVAARGLVLIYRW